MSPQQKWLALAAAGILLAVAPSCKALKKPYPDQRSYLLQTTRDAPSPLAGRSLVFHLLPVAVAGGYSGTEFVYRQPDGTVIRDYYHRFFDLPGSLLSESLAAWLAGEGMDPLVLRTAGPGEVTHVLQVRVLSLLADHSEAPGRAVLEMEVLLREQRGRAQVPTFRKVYRQAPTLPDNAPASLAAAWNRSLHVILSQLDADLAALDLEPWSAPEENRP